MEDAKILLSFFAPLPLCIFALKELIPLPNFTSFAGINRRWPD